MLKRTLDPTNLNRVCNHPEVRPWLKGSGTIDVTALVTDPRNFTFEIEGGGFICISKGHGIYEGHSQFIPEARRYTLQSLYATMDYLFTRTDCTILTTYIPDDNPMADALGRKAGFKPIGVRLEHGPYAPCEIRAVKLEDWIERNQSLETEGDRFHALIEAAKLAYGIELQDHADDLTHDRFAGAAVRMSARGNIAKAAQTYNAWAAVAGYEPIAVVSEIPPVMDVGQGFAVGFDENNEMTLLKHP